MCLGIVGFVFAEALELVAGKAEGWTFYLSSWEVFFEVAVRLIFAALVGAVFGTLLTAIIVPILGFLKSSRGRVIEWTTTLAVLLAAFAVSRYALEVLIAWSYTVLDHKGIIDMALRAAFYLFFAVALFIPRLRKKVVSNFDGLVTEKMTRRVVLAAVAGVVALSATEFALSHTVRTVRAAALAPQSRPQSNILLITFDALSAEDMSLYGKALPTTPNIDAFARHATTFTNFYSASTFTTPSVAIVMTGLYPSQSRVQQLQGRISAEVASKSVPRLLREAGYTTAGFFSNPYAYYLAKSVENEYDFLPETIFQDGAMRQLWSATTPLHQDSGFGARIEEYIDLAWDWSLLTGQPDNLYERYPAAATFRGARQLLQQLPDGFFLWVHVMTPHGPYIPDAANLGRFYQGELGKGHPKDTAWKPHYPPGQQPTIDHWHLRYDEFVATADREFGSFMSDLEAGGRLRNTTVIVSADHGESFEGGMFQHGGPYQTRPVVHIPLLVRTPNQQSERTVSLVADQTSLAPTILAMAGLAKPDTMRGQSLLPLIDDQQTANQKSLAFCQYFETNSVFRPLHYGTVGVLDGEYQYVLDLHSDKGSLRPMNQAQIWNLDQSSENPERARQLRAAIISRFPELHLNK